MEYSYYDSLSFYTKVKIPPTTFERRNLAKKLLGKDLVVQDFEDKNVSFKTSINIGNMFETGFLMYITTQKKFTFIPYESMDKMKILVGPWFEPLKI